MARPISDEELQLKKRARRRLVGAIVLVSAVAVILPMVLDSEPRPVTQNVDIQIPSPDSGDFKPKSAAAPGFAAAPAKGPGSLVSGAPTSTAVAAAPLKGMPPAAAPAKDAAPKAEKSADSTDGAEDKGKAAASDADAASGAYVVQVAALSDGARVKQLQKQMSAAGVRTYTEAISTKTGEITRVRAGPYATREAAESARTQLKKAGLDGKVVAR
jgi:DedD protein